MKYTITVTDLSHVTCSKEELFGNIMADQGFNKCADPGEEWKGEVEHPVSEWGYVKQVLSTTIDTGDKDVIRRACQSLRAKYPDFDIFPIAISWKVKGTVDLGDGKSAEGLGCHVRQWGNGDDIDLEDIGNAGPLSM